MSAIAAWALAATLTAGTVAPEPPKPLTPRIWPLIAQCETGHTAKKPALNHWTLRYVSALGINKTTWRNWSGLPPKAAAKMTWAQQVEIAERIAWRGYQNTKQNRWVHPVGPWGWGCAKSNPEVIRIICASRKPEVQRWKRNC